MASRTTEQPSKALALLLLAAVGVFVFLTAYRLQQWDTDIFWALKSGEWIWANNGAPKADPFSYTFGGQPWVDFTWGFQAIAHLFFTYLGGWAGLFALQLIVSGLTFLFLYAALHRLSGARAWLASALTLAVFVSAHSRFFIRPHLFEYFFIALYFLLLTLHEKDARRWCLWALIPIHVVWVNIHSSAVLGFFIVGAYAAGEVVDGAMRSRSVRAAFSPKAVKLAVAAALLPVAGLINPYGWRLVVFPFIHQAPDKADALKHIAEWVRPGLRELFFYFYPFPLDHFAFVLIFLAVLVCLAFSLRTLRVRWLIILAGALYMASTHARWTTLFGLMAAPALAELLSGLLGGHPLRERRVRLAALAAGVFFAVVMAVEFSGARFRDNLGLGVRKGSYPEGTAAFMKKEGIRGNIFNEYVFGGYLIYHLPEVRVFIDGRTPTVYSPYFFWTSRLVDDPPMWKKLVEEHSIDMALIKLRSTHCENLWKDTEWKAVAFDDVSALFLKDTPGFTGLVSRHALARANPCSLADKYELPADKPGIEEMERELGRALVTGSASGARALRLRALALTELGGERLGEAAELLERAVALNPEAHTYYDLGLTLGKLRRYADSVLAFDEAIRLDKGFKEAYLGAGLSLYEAKDFGKAAVFLEKYRKLADDNARQVAYKALGESLFELGEFKRSAVYLRRAAFKAESVKDAANMHYWLANALFEAGELAEGRVYYLKALAAEPEYRLVLKNLADTLQAKGLTGKSSLLYEVLDQKGPR